LNARKGDCLQSDDQDGDLDLRDALATSRMISAGSSVCEAPLVVQRRSDDGSRRVLLSMESSGGGCQERPVERSLLHPPARV
jgi:hypothetical protein